MYRGIIEGHIFLTTFLRNQIVDRGLQQPFHRHGPHLPHRPRGAAARHAAGGRAGRRRRRGCPCSRIPTATGATWRSGCSSRRARRRSCRRCARWRCRTTTRACACTRCGRSRGSARPTTTWCARGWPTLRRTCASPRCASPKGAWRRQPCGARCWRWPTTRTSPSVARCSTRSGRRRRPTRRRRACACCVATSTAPFVVDAFMSGLAGRERQTLDTLVRSPLWASDRPEHRALVTALATAIGNEGRAERRRGPAAAVGGVERRPAWQREAVLAGVKAASRAGSPRRPRRHLATPRRPRSSSRGARRTPSVRACHQADGRGLPALAPPLAGRRQCHGPARRRSSTSSCTAATRTRRTRACRRWRRCRTTSWRPS